jgi:antitoxin MazE
MLVKIQKWGNSLGIRIPKTFAREIMLKENAIVEISIKEGNIVVSPSKIEYTFDDLVSKITEENLHHEISTGSQVGNEIW